MTKKLLLAYIAMLLVGMTLAACLAPSQRQEWKWMYRLERAH